MSKSKSIRLCRCGAPRPANTRCRPCDVRRATVRAQQAKAAETKARAMRMRMDNRITPAPELAGELVDGGFCAQCADRPGYIKRPLEAGGHAYVLCKECDSEHPRSGRYSFGGRESTERVSALSLVSNNIRRPSRLE